jgi:hypothetical protein
MQPSGIFASTILKHNVGFNAAAPIDVVTRMQ